MKTTKLLLLGLSVVLIFFAGEKASGQSLKLIPAPREVQTREGRLAINANTRIVVGAAHAKEDHLAAEMLAEEIESANGLKIQVTSARRLPKQAGTIYLARVDDDAALRSALQAQSLAIDDKFDEEGYVLSADKNRILVAARSGAGVFYGVQTLRQLLAPEEGKTASARQLSCPAVTIRDWPAMRWRGVHDDISRGPVPTLDFMKKQVRTLAEYKINLFSLYIEHVFDYQENPLIAPKEGALTAAEVKELVEYAKRYYVTLLPEQQASGHLHHVLKTEVYSELAETPHGHVLAPVNEKTYEFIRSMYAELVPLFPGPLFHIGSDETYELGRGQSKARAEEIGLGRLYLEHLRRVSELMKPYNKRLMFWHDIAAHYPELLGILPKDMIPVIWDYAPRESFEKEIKPFRDAGFEVFVSPGASNWNRIFPDLESAYVNIRNLGRDAQKFQALGMLNTTWDDDGEALFGMTWPAVIFGAAAAWQPGEASIEQFKASYDWAFYRNNDATFREAIDALARSHALLNSAGLGGAWDDLFWTDPFSESGARTMERALPIARDLRLAAERALEVVYRHRAHARVHADTLDALTLAAMRLDALGMKIQFTGEIGKLYWEAYLNLGDRRSVGSNLGEISNPNGRLEDLRDATTRVRAAYSELWLKENRPYWLGNVLVRYDHLTELYYSKSRAVQAALQHYREKSTLPAPDQIGFFLKPRN
jgi:hypothetical protein